jgi:predicted transcriptional regulator
MSTTLRSIYVEVITLQQTPKLSESELEVMQVIWGQAAPVTTSTLLAAFRGSRSWKSQTINTFLTRLVEKGALTVQKQGVANHYTAAISEEDYRRGETRAFLHEVHHGSLRSLIAALGDADTLSGEEIERLKLGCGGDERSGCVSFSILQRRARPASLVALLCLWGALSRRRHGSRWLAGLWGMSAVLLALAALPLPSCPCSGCRRVQPAQAGLAWPAGLSGARRHF